MRLVEKKCLECGNAIGFGENDTSCECKQCHKKYKIQKDINNILDYNLIAIEEKKKNPLVTVGIVVGVLLVILVLVYVIMHLGS